MEISKNPTYYDLAKFGITVNANFTRFLLNLPSAIVIGIGQNFNRIMIKPIVGVTDPQIAGGVTTVTNTLAESLLAATGDPFRETLKVFRLEKDIDGEYNKATIILERQKNESLKDGERIERYGYDGCKIILATINLPKVSIYWSKIKLENVKIVDGEDVGFFPKVNGDYIMCDLILNEKHKQDIKSLRKKTLSIERLFENVEDTAVVFVQPGIEAEVIDVKQGEKGIDGVSGGSDGKITLMYKDNVTEENAKMFFRSLRPGMKSFYSIHTQDPMTQKVAGVLDGYKNNQFIIDAQPYFINYDGTIKQGAQQLNDHHKSMVDTEGMTKKEYVLVVRSKRGVGLSPSVKDPIKESIESAITNPLNQFRMQLERDVDTGAIKSILDATKSYVAVVVLILIVGLFLMNVSSTVVAEYIRDRFRKPYRTIKDNSRQRSNQRKRTLR